MDKYRLVTRSDFDGLVCAVLLQYKRQIADIVFVHPKDVQDGKIALNEFDITANLPYSEKVHICFDHHYSEVLRVGDGKNNHVIDPDAPSAARVVYNYYGGKDGFPHVSEDLLLAVDKSDSAKFSKEDVLEPKGWDLLNFIMDSRTGLGRYHHFSVSNYELMMDLIGYCGRHPIENILALPDVSERVKLYQSHKELFKKQIEDNSEEHGSVLYVNLKDQEQIYVGNRFMKYAMYPDCKVSIQEIWGRGRENTVFTVGMSIFNPDPSVNIGSLMLEYGGGGHRNAGTCQVSNEDAERVRRELIEKLGGK